ncbi:MAG: hypothetical protein SV186_03955, partial [Candidatus Nanohaloarchaea archaeon]|nr:hypothetical protein [Candidatus Nanohaloarchaea archaeon]
MSTVERKGVIAFIVIGLLTVLGGSAAAAPHHPLSQIYPMDVDLNLSGQDINELGDLRLAGGSATVDGTINMSGNEIVEYVTDARSGAPTSPAAGQMWFDSGQNVLKYYNGTNWVITASASSVSSDLQSVLGAGNSAGSYDLNMSGNSILSVEHMTSKTGSHIYVRKREAENQASNCGTDVTDTNASGGAARSSSGCGSGGGLFSWGPYWQVPPGNYQVIWRLKTSDATSSSRQVCVRATGGDGKEACLSGNDFDAAGQYQIVTTPLRFTTDSSDIELYARDYGAATITLDAITIRAATSGLGAQHFGNVDLNNNDINSVGRINADGGLLAGGTGQSIGIGTNEVGRDPIGNLSDWQTSWVLADGGLGGYKRNLYFQDNQGNVVMRFGATGGINMYGNQISGVSQVTLNNGAYIDEGTADYGDIRVGGRCESGWCGINIQGQSDYVLMTDESGTDDVGLYADDPNNWLWRYDASKNHKDNYKDIDMNKNQLKRVTSVSSRIIEVNGAKMENFEGASEQSDGDMS